MIWRERRLLLIILGVLLAANTIFFFTYRVQYENRLRSLDERLNQVKAQRDEARSSRVVAEQQLAAYHKVQSDIRQIYDVEWSTESQRLTPFLGEIMHLGVVSELVPKSYSFSGTSTKMKSAGTPGANALEVGVSFPVEGTYQQIRRLINLLEVSDQFVIIDQLSLASASGDKLNMTLRLKTLFRNPTTTPPPRAPNQES